MARFSWNYNEAMNELKLSRTLIKCPVDQFIGRRERPTLRQYGNHALSSVWTRIEDNQYAWDVQPRLPIRVNVCPVRAVAWLIRMPRGVAHTHRACPIREASCHITNIRLLYLPPISLPPRVGLCRSSAGSPSFLLENNVTREDSQTPDARQPPYSEFLQNLTDYVLPVFEGSIEPRPEFSQLDVSREAFTSEADIGGGGAGVGANATANVATPPEGGSIASEISGASASGLPPASPSGMTAETMARIIGLEMAGGSSAEGDLELARSLLPDPAVPAPDPKLLPIPAHKVRQLLRRPAPRMHRTPLTR